MATDFLLAGYNKIVALLQAGQTDDLINRWVLFDGRTTSKTDEARSSRKAAELPELLLDIDTATDSGNTQNRVLSFASAASVSWERQIVATYKATITSDSPLLSSLSAIYTAISTDLANSGTGNVGGVGYKMFFGKMSLRNRRTMRSESVPSGFRRVADILIPSTLVFRGESQLT